MNLNRSIFVKLKYYIGFYKIFVFGFCFDISLCDQYQQFEVEMIVIIVNLNFRKFVYFYFSATTHNEN